MPPTAKKLPTTRLKESYRDVHGHVHSLILLNIGFEPTLHTPPVHRIAEFLSDRFENRDTLSLFNPKMSLEFRLYMASRNHPWFPRYP